MNIGLDLLPLQTSSATRGIGNYVRELYRHLLRVATEHEFVLFNVAPRAGYHLVLENQNAREYRWDDNPYPDLRAYYPAQLQKRVSEFVRHEKIDLFIAASPFDYWDIYKRHYFPCPVVAIVYDIIPLIFEKRYLNQQLRPHYLERVKFLVQADRLLVISENTGRDLINYLNIPENRISAILGGINPAFQPRQGNITATRAKYGIRDKFVLCTGAMDARKNQEGLIRAFAALRPELKADRQLVITCEMNNDYARHLESIAAAAGVADSLVLSNYVALDELIDLYCAAEMFVFPSFYEGLGLPIVEAMACGTPVITSATSSLQEIGKGAALLVDPGDVDSITGAMTEVLTNQELRLSMVQLGFKRAAGLTWEVAAGQTIAAISTTTGELPGKEVKILHTVGVLVADEENCSGQAIKSDGHSGYLVYGPYLNIDPGQYVVCFKIKLLAANRMIREAEEVAVLDVCTSMGNVTLTAITLKRRDFGQDQSYHYFDLNFEVKERLSNVEFRVYDRGTVYLASDPHPIVYRINNQKWFVDSGQQNNPRQVVDALVPERQVRVKI